MNEKINEKKVRLALFGPGGFGRERALAMVSNPLIELVACYSPVEEERLAGQAEFGVQAAETESLIWDDPSIDGVILATPNQVHLEQARRAAQAGKHVFVEKPIAPRLEEGIQIVETCAQAGILLMVGHNDRRRGYVRLIKQYIESGKLGKVLAVDAHNSHAGGLDIRPGEWRWSSANCPGGPLIQLGIHHTDTLHYLVGPVRRVSAWQRRLVVAAEIPDTSMALLEFESGALGYLGNVYAIPHLRFIHVLGTTANARWDSGFGMRVESDQGSETIHPPQVDTLQEEIEEFARCILTNSQPEVGGKEALHALAVIEAAVLSEQRRRPVDIAELEG